MGKKNTQDSSLLGPIIEVGKIGKKKIGFRINDLRMKKNRSFTCDDTKETRQLLREIKSLGMPLLLSGSRAKSGSDSKPIYFGSYGKTVKSIVESETDLKVTFVEPAAREYFVRKSNPDIELIRKNLVRSQRLCIAYWFVTLDYDSDSRIEVVGAPFEVEDFSCCYTHRIDPQFDEHHHRATSTKKANHIFKLFKRMSTKPNRGPLVGIPFRYIDNGCEHRCHEMCRILLEQDIYPMKAWAFSKNRENLLIFKSKYHPNCEVRWGHHTAPAVLTDNGYYVIDPSVASKALPVRKWYRKFSNPYSRLHLTSHHTFKMLDNLCDIQSDPQYLETRHRLRIFRVNLRLLSRRLGPLPFKKCK